MREYVIVNAIGSKGKVLLVQKERPEWQKGFFNLVGGKIENEGCAQAALRELKEETGLVGSVPNLMGLIEGENELVYCFNVHVVDSMPLRPRDGETEKVAWVEWADVVHDPRLLPSVRLIYPLMHGRVWNWHVTVEGSMMGTDYHAVTVEMPGDRANIFYKSPAVDRAFDPPPKKKPRWKVWA